MKKTLLIIATIAIALNVNAQSVWNFSNAPFGSAAATGGSTTPTVTFTSTFTVNGLTVGTDGITNWTGLTANNKTIDAINYYTRLQTGGGGGNILPSRIPVTRYLSINVTGGSEIKFGMISSSSSATRTLILVNEGETFLDSIVNISGTSALTYTYNYTGGATKLYFYSRSSGLNYYYLSATNVVTSTQNVLTDKGISYDGSQITNSKNLNVEVFNVLGKLVTSSKTDINTSNLPRGVYMVRAEGVNGAMKISVQ